MLQGKSWSLETSSDKIGDWRDASSLDKGSQLLICQSFKPGHNVHWMQLRESEESVNAMVNCLDREDGIESPLEQTFGLLLPPEDDDPQWEVAPAELTFRLHNPGPLRRLVDQVDAAFTYCRSSGLLSATHPSMVGTVVFYPSFTESTPCQYRGEDSPLHATVTQVVVDGLLGSLDPEL